MWPTGVLPVESSPVGQVFGRKTSNPSGSSCAINGTPELLITNGVPYDWGPSRASCTSMDDLNVADGRGLRAIRASLWVIQAVLGEEDAEQGEEHQEGQQRANHGNDPVPLMAQPAARR